MREITKQEVVAIRVLDKRLDQQVTERQQDQGSIYQKDHRAHFSGKDKRQIKQLVCHEYRKAFEMQHITGQHLGGNSVTHHYQRQTQQHAAQRHSRSNQKTTRAT